MNRVLPIFSRQLIYPLRFLSASSKNNSKIYTDSDEWISKEKMGITKYAIEQLNEIIYLEFQRDKGEKLEKGEDMVVIESIKAAESIEAPYDCILLENNELIENDLDNTINLDPECEQNSWIVKIKKL